MTLTRRKIGNRAVCPIGLGCMSLSWAYGRQPPEKEATDLLHRALDLGYDHLDTARLYGFGHNETLIGEALKGQRNRFFLASKAGIELNRERTVNCRPENLRAACEDSLKALQTDYIDLYYLHRYDRDVPIEESVGALGELAREGKIGGIGLSEMSADTLRRAAQEHPITAVQNEYSLWTRDSEIAVLQACRELGTTFVAFSPLGRGVFADSVRDIEQLPEKDLRAKMPRFQPENWSHNRSLIETFNGLAADEGVSPAQLALAWVLSRGEHVLAIPGTGRMAHMEENIAHWQWQPSPGTLTRLDDLINQDTVQGHRYPEAMRASIDTEEFA